MNAFEKRVEQSLREAAESEEAARAAADEQAKLRAAAASKSAVIAQTLLRDAADLLSRRGVAKAACVERVTQTKGLIFREEETSFRSYPETDIWKLSRDLVLMGGGSPKLASACIGSAPEDLYADIASNLVTSSIPDLVFWPARTAHRPWQNREHASVDWKNRACRTRPGQVVVLRQSISPLVMDGCVTSSTGSVCLSPGGGGTPILKFVTPTYDSDRSDQVRRVTLEAYLLEVITTLLSRAQ